MAAENVATEIRKAFTEASPEGHKLIPIHLIHRFATLSNDQSRDLHYLYTNVVDNRVDGIAIIFTESIVLHGQWTNGSNVPYDAKNDIPVDISIWPRRQLTSISMPGTQSDINFNTLPSGAIVHLNYAAPQRILKLVGNTTQLKALSEFLTTLINDLT